jgi:hypothetical protein
MGITYKRVSSTPCHPCFPVSRFFEQAVIPLPNKVCQRSDGGLWSIAAVSLLKKPDLRCQLWDSNGYHLQTSKLNPLSPLLSSISVFLNKLSSRCQTKVVNGLTAAYEA